MGDASRHIPVLETSVLEQLRPLPGESVLDCTLGLGGHARRFLEATAPGGTLVGIDADGENLAAARRSLAPFEGRTRLIHANFGDAATLGLPAADIVFADLGVSSPHFDDPARGMSFRAEGPLDMRFDRTGGRTAARRIADATEHELVFVLRTYGELTDVRRLIAGMKQRPPETTAELAALAREAYGWKAPQLLPQVFQALRMWVNDECAALERLLAALPALLSARGRAGIITFHSLEDRLVKHAFRSLCSVPKDPVTGKAQGAAAWESVPAKGIVPSASEVAENPRARSARLRVIRRLP